jgi:hypothetical protein
MQTAGIHAEIFDLLLSFGRKPKNSDAGGGAMSVKRSSTGVVCMCDSGCYFLSFLAN